MSSERYKGVFIYLSEAQIKALDKIKKKKRIPKSLIIRTALEKYLNEEA
jgi:predicted DNA-binding protein